MVGTVGERLDGNRRIDPAAHRRHRQVAQYPVPSRVAQPATPLQPALGCVEPPVPVGQLERRIHETRANGAVAFLRWYQRRTE